MSPTNSPRHPRRPNRTRTLRPADKVFEYVLKELKQLKGVFASLLLEKVEKRINERRLPKLSTLLAYLEDPCFFEELVTETVSLEYATLDDVVLTAKDLYLRLYPSKSPISQSQGNTDDTADPDDPPPPKRSRSEELKNVLVGKKKKSDMYMSARRGGLSDIEQELILYHATGKRGVCLDKLIQALYTIAPTSVEAERIFSAAGLYVTKLRSSLKDSSIENLLMLRSHFMNEKKK